MAQQINKLTARAVLAFTDPEADPQPKPGRYGDGGGLWLSVSPNGGRRWTFLYRWNGRLREMGLGSARRGARNYLSLKQARDAADAARVLLKARKDPLAAKHHKPTAVPTFGTFADTLTADMASGFSNEKHRKQWKMSLTKYAAPLRDKPLNEITTEDVLGVLKPIWETKNETASRLRGRIEHVLSAAKVQGYRTGDNPAEWRNHLQRLLPARQKLSRGHHAALPFAEVPAFMVKLREREAPSARALEFLILSATRSGEARAATWREFDLDKGIWTIPAQRMKSKREHRAPISARMKLVLQKIGVGEPHEFVFPGPGGDKGLSEGSYKVLLKRMKFDHITAHGFRSAFKDWAAECTSFPNEVSEMALAHVIGDKTEAAYRRGDLFDKRRKLMEAWAGYCSAPREGKVVSINRETVVTP